MATVVLLLAISLLGGCMPGATPAASSKQLARNEEKLREQGIIALEIGAEAPSFSAVGTAGSSLSIGSSAVETVAEPPAETALEPLGEPQATPPGDTAVAAEAVSADAAPVDAAPVDAAQVDADKSGDAEAETSPADAQPVVETESAVSSVPKRSGNIVLLFFPAVNTPNSAKQLVSFDKAAADLEAKGLTVYGINTATLGELDDFAKRYEIKTPLLTDSDGSISVAYGCMVEGGRFPQRTAVVIDPDNKVVVFHRGQTTPQILLHELKLDGKPAAADNEKDK